MTNHLLCFQKQPQEMFCKKRFPQPATLLKRETLLHVFSCKFCEISIKTFFYRISLDDCFCVLSERCFGCVSGLFSRFNGATKSLFIHCSCVVIILFHVYLNKSAFSTHSLKLSFYLSVFSFLLVLFRIRCALQRLFITFV